MPRLGAIQPSFTGGEWAPSLYARLDLQKYSTALRLCENFTIHPHGEVSNRAGTEFVSEVKSSSERVRLIPFEFSVEQAYALEFGNLYMRIYRDGGIVVDPAGSGDDIVLAATYKWTASGSGTNEYYVELLAGGDPSLLEPANVYEDVGGADTSMPLGILGSLAAGGYGYGDNDSLGYSTIYVRLTDEVDPDTKGDGYLEAGYPAEIVTPYGSGDLARLKFTQSADTMYLTHPDYAPRKLTRTDHHVWSITTIIYGASVPTPTTLTSSGGSESFKVSAVDAAGLESVAAGPVNANASGGTLGWDPQAGVAHFNVYKADNGIFGFVKSVDGAGNGYTTANIIPDLNTTAPVTKDPFGSITNYPGVSSFFEQRLVFARTDAKPQTLWGSVTGDFENQNISDPLRDDDAYNFTINALQVNEILWMTPLNNELLIGTSGAEWKMSSGSRSDAVTPTNVKLTVQSRWGSADLQAQVIGNSIIFLQRGANLVRDLRYDFGSDGYTGSDLSILATHLFKDHTISEWSYQGQPTPIIFCVRDDGVLLALTYAKEHDVWGWARYTTDGEYESVTVVPNTDGTDDTYVVVKRTIGGATKRYVEIFKERLPDDDVEQGWFVDCGLQLNNPIDISGATKANPVVVTATSHGFANDDLVDIRGVLGMTELNGVRYRAANVTANTFELTAWDGGADIDGTGFTTYISGGNAYEALTSISGLSHLEGKELAILANGSVLPRETVVGGAVTLDVPGSLVTIGLPYESNLETLEIELPVEGGTLQDRKRQLKSVTVRLEKTRSLWAGPSAARILELQFRQFENYDTAIGLFTGDREMFINAGPTDEGRLYLRVKDPVPVTILALMPKVEHGDL